MYKKRMHKTYRLGIAKYPLKGKWKKVTGEAKKKWGKLTDDDIDQAEGDMQKLAGIVQERYGIVREEADKQVKSWTDSMDD